MNEIKTKLDYFDIRLVSILDYLNGDNKMSDSMIIKLARLLPNSIYKRKKRYDLEIHGIGCRYVWKGGQYACDKLLDYSHLVRGSWRCYDFTSWSNVNIWVSILLLDGKIEPWRVRMVIDYYDYEQYYNIEKTIKDFNIKIN